MNQLKPRKPFVRAAGFTEKERWIRRQQLNPLKDALLHDPIANSIARRYECGEIKTLVDCLMEMAIHCSAAARQAQAREIETIRQGFSMKHREF